MSLQTLDRAPTFAMSRMTLPSRLLLGSVGLVWLAVGFLAGCKGLGPLTVPRDRFEYSHSISESWKRQTLLNIVKLRYLDPPIFVDVGQIVAGYSLETSLNAGVSLPESDSLGGNTFLFGGAARFTDRPTVTYTPLTGSRFIKGLMMPLPPDTLFFMMQSGWPADSLIQATIASVNGARNETASIAGVAAATPEFERVTQLLRQIQSAGALAVRVREQTDGPPTTEVELRAHGGDVETSSAIVELRALLGLDEAAESYSVVFGSTPASDREMAVVSRSILHIMQAIAIHVDVPPEHVAEGRATPGFPPGSSQSLLQIHSSPSEPEQAFVAVPYRGRWFWIDDRNLATKRAFAFILFLFTLTDSGQRNDLPLITIPTQ